MIRFFGCPNPENHRVSDLPAPLVEKSRFFAGVQIPEFKIPGVLIPKFNHESLFWVSNWLAAELAWHPVCRFSVFGLVLFRFVQTDNIHDPCVSRAIIFSDFPQGALSTCGIDPSAPAHRKSYGSARPSSLSLPGFRALFRGLHALPTRVASEVVKHLSATESPACRYPRGES